MKKLVAFALALIFLMATFAGSAMAAVTQPEALPDWAVDSGKARDEIEALPTFAGLYYSPEGYRVLSTNPSAIKSKVKQISERYDVPFIVETKRIRYTYAELEAGFDAVPMEKLAVWKVSLDVQENCLIVISEKKWTSAMKRTLRQATGLSDSAFQLRTGENELQMLLDAEDEEIPEVSVTDPGAIGYARATGRVNIRSGPGTNYKKLGQVKKGQALELVGTTGSWIIVKWQGGTAYASKQYFKLSEAPKSLSPQELHTMLQEQGFFTQHKDILLGTWVDQRTNTLNLRIKSSENVTKIGDAIRAALGTSTASGKILVHRSSLPRTVDAAYLDKLADDIFARYEKLSKSQQAGIELASANYDPAKDRLVVELVKRNSTKERNFKRYLSNWQYITFESVDSLAVLMG